MTIRKIRIHQPNTFKKIKTTLLYERDLNSPTENKLSQSSLNVMLTLFTVKSLIDGFRYSIFTLNISKWIIAYELCSIDKELL